MKENFLQEAEKYTRQNRRRRAWRKLVQVMACVVVFCTTYALILPAITLERNMCGMEEHTHTDSCYEKVKPEAAAILSCTYESLGVHVHTQDCYDGENQLICGQLDYLVHVHNAACLDENGATVCQIPEVHAHAHTDACYQIVETEPAETEAPVEPEAPAEETVHTHGDACYTLERGELICELEEFEGHIHAESCYQFAETPNCGLEEKEGHTHGDGCSETVQVCDLTVEPHVHGGGCYQQRVCEIPEGEEHTHTEECTGSILACNLTEQPHTHGNGCYETRSLCDLPETEGHAHSTACYESTLICELDEKAGHSHTDDCYNMVSVLSCGLEEGVVPAPTEEPQEEPQEDPQPELELICQEPVVQEHIHSEDCYVEEIVEEDTLTCTLAEDENHTHGDMCYGTWELICGLEEHSHDLACWSDPEADVETEAIWTATFAGVHLTGARDADLLAIAQSQLGYQESTRNYEVMEDGETIKGYTRYGDWYGMPYGDWDAMFVSFCLNYAGISGFPQDSSSSSWVAALRNQNMYAPASEYIPSNGDLIFFDWNADSSADHVGIVAAYLPADEENEAQVQCIEGDSGNAVRYTTYNLSDSRILGYGQLIPGRTQVPAVEDSAEEAYYDHIATANIVGLEEIDAESPALLKTSRVRMTAARSTPIPMDSMIKKVTVFKKQNGSWVAVPNGGTVTQGEDLKFTIDYVVDANTLSANANTLVYNIPSNIENVGTNQGLVYDKYNNEVGTFVITNDAKGNGIITITFNDEYVTNNSAYSKPIEGSISIFATVTEISDGSDDEKDIIFSDTVKIDMGVVEPEEVVGDLRVKKEIVEVNGADILFKITVTSTDGTYSEVTLTDKMTGGLSYKEDFIVTDKDGNPVPGILAPDPASSNFTLTLPQMEAQDQYTITYVAGAADSHVIVNNKATVNSTNSKDVNINHFAEVDHTFKLLDKTGEPIGVDSDGKYIMQWTIVINEDKQDISGWTLVDIMQDTNGDRDYLPKDLTVTITDSKGNTYEGINLPFKFPEGCSDTYTVTYTTTHDQVSGDNVVGNWAGLQYDDKGNDIGDTEWVGIGTNYPVTKEGEILSANPQTGGFIIQWTITLDTSNGPLPAESYIQDKLDTDQYMTYDQMMQMVQNVSAAIQPHNLTLQNVLGIDAETGERLNYNQMDQAGNTKTYKRFYVQFKEPIPEGIKFSFSFEATADKAPPYHNYFQNRVNINNTAEYTAKVYYISTKPIIAKYGIDPTHDYQLYPNDTGLNYDDLSELGGKKTVWWLLRLQIPKGYNEAITIKDTLPEGLELVETIAQPNGSAGERKIVSPDGNGKGLFNWYDTYYMDMAVTTGTDGKQVVTYQMSQATANVLADSFMDLYLACKFRDDFQWGDPNAVITQVPFTNTVTAQSPDGEPFSTAEHTFVVRYDNSDEVVSKLGTMTEQNELQYEVVLNEKGRDLDPDHGTIQVKDVLTYVSPNAVPIRLYLKPDSVNVYDYTGGVKGALITSAKYTRTDQAVPGENSTTYTHTLDLVLPDSQPMLLEYTYLVNGQTNDFATYDMINTCTITGIANGSISDDDKINIKVYESYASANYNGVYIYKVDANNNKLHLPGAVFHLYAWNKTEQKYVLVANPDVDPNNEDPSAFTTNEKGVLALATEDEETEDEETEVKEPIAFNTAYYIIEHQPPNGYFKNPKPYYFYVHDDDTYSHPMNLPTGFQGDKLTNGALIYYVNEPNTTELVIHKKWQDHNGSPITVTADQVASIRFELWQKMGDVERLYGTYTVTPDRNGFWEKVITGLPKGIPNPDDGTKGTLYTYYIKEVSVPNYQVHYEYVDGNGVTVSPSGGINSGTITMTNRELEGYELPATGGAGTTPYTMAGLLLMLLSAAYLMYKYQKRRKEVL